jgi:hypothetical protein
MIIAGIASINTREHLLRRALKSIYPQVDKVYAVLNNYSKLPDWITSISNVEAIVSDNSMSDAGKFLFTSKYEDCYFLSIDDDMVYGNTYASDMVAGVDKYNGVVSHHGRVYPRPFVDYKHWTANYRCLGTVNHDVPVDLVGTGCCAFHTSRLKVDIKDFPYRNMADVFISVLAHQQSVPMWVLAHKRNYIRYLFPEGETIWRTETDTTRQTNLLRQVLV